MDTLNGLSQIQVEKLRKKFGFNELPIKDRKSFFKTLLRIITEPMFTLLLIAAGIYLLIGSIDDAALLSCFIFLSITLTTYQEYKSDKAIEALKDLSSPRALVLRNGNSQRIPGREVMVGDLIILEEGDRIAADAKVIEAHDLLIDESLLTGESEPIEKLQDQLIFSGCLVVRGGGIAVVQSIGLHTEMGKIGKSLEQIIDPPSPLQAGIHILVKRFAMFGIGLSVVVCLLYGLIYTDWLGGALTGISLTMALLPEEFTVILTVFMAMGVWRISRQHVLARRASVIETLGSINTLCVDKTGTLTLNKMSLQALATLGDKTDLLSENHSISPSQQQLLSYAVLASETNPFDPMEKAFHESLEKLYPEHLTLYQNHQFVYEYGLSPELPAMTHIWQTPNHPNHFLIAIKGSPEAVLALCHLSAQDQAIVEVQIKILASQGLRLLGVAKASYSKESNQWPSSIKDFSFEWLGLVGLKDPLRPEVPEAVRQCQNAGIRVVMITGDHAMTARAIASQAGIPSELLVSGSDIERFTDKQLENAIKETCVFVRIKPNQKLALVKALQANQEIVAMTGDGINDAPALKAAHVGIAMGQRGTDVAREASSLVLLNDDFSSIVNTIKQGRQIYDNLQKAMMYVVAVHIPIAGVVFFPLLIGAPPMIGPIHILFLEMIIDPTCAIVFESEPPESNLMNQPPRNPEEKIFNTANLSIAILQGLGLLAIVLTLYLGLPNLGYNSEVTNTVSFVTLVLGNLFLVIVSRSKNAHFITILKKRNVAQYWIIGAATALLILLTWIPFIRERFKFSELTHETGWIVAIATTVGLLWYELIKYIYRSKFQKT